MVIVGSIVTVRDAVAEDGPFIVAWRNRPDVSRWLPQWEPLTLESHLRWFAQAEARQDVQLMFVANGTPVATTGFYNFDRDRTCCEWGRLSGASERHPLAVAEGCYLGHRYIFEKLGVQRAYSITEAENGTAQRLHLFLGYRQEGHRRRHLLTPVGYKDQIEYGLLDEEFAAHRPQLERLLYRHEPVPGL